MEEMPARAAMSLLSLEGEITRQVGDSVHFSLWRDACQHDEIHKNQSRDFRKIFSEAKTELLSKHYISIDESKHVSIIK